jgi:hypothetical protein
MSRALAALCLIALLAPASAEPGDKVKKVRLRTRLHPGERYLGSNTVSFTLKTAVRQGDRVTHSNESVQRTERFVDKVVRAGENGITEIHRDYTRFYTKARDSEGGRPTVHRSPMQGRSVVLLENQRRREVKLEGRGALDPIVRRIAGMELDWRDLFNEDAIGPGDVWEADVTALARRLAAYLRCGTRSKMRVRYEENVEVDGVRLAKFYLDWTLEGMRDRRLYTKVVVAGDLYFDLEMERVVLVDLGGSIVVRGALIGEGPPRIVKGEGKVTVHTSIKRAPVQAAPKGDTKKAKQ